MPLFSKHTDSMGLTTLESNERLYRSECSNWNSRTYSGTWARMRVNLSFGAKPGLGGYDAGEHLRCWCHDSHVPFHDPRRAVVDGGGGDVVCVELVRRSLSKQLS